MEHEVEGLRPLRQTEFRGGDPLALGKHVRLELHVARLVNAMHIAEGGREQITAVLPCPERIDGLLEVLRAGVELLVDLGLHAVLLATDHTDLDLEDDLGRRANP